MGKFITRIRPGDKELWDRLVEEARRLCETDTPRPQAVAHLLQIAGDNPRAFGGIGGKSTRGLSRTSEGKAVLRLLGNAASERAFRSRVGVPRVIGRKRTHEEKVLAAMPVSESFALLAQREPRLLTVADEALRVAESARAAGEDESSVRASISGLFACITAIDPIVGPKASGHSENPGLVVTETATQVVWTHLVSITDVPFLDLQEHPEHTERAQVATEIVDSIDIGDPRSKAEFRAELEEALTERGMTLPSHQLDGLAAGLELRSDPKRAAVKAVLKTLRGTKQCE